MGTMTGLAYALPRLAVYLLLAVIVALIALPFLWMISSAFKDPTTIYAAMLDERYRGTIYRSDLASDNAYNTYQHTGLPPGPIANPGAASLKAALAPASTEYLYFVAKADGSGRHNFSKTMEEHNRAVGAYRKAQKKAVAEPEKTGKPHRRA